MNNLSNFYQERGHFAEAETLQKALLEVRERIFGEGSMETMRPMNNLGNIYASMGRFDEAIPLWNRALELLEKAKECALEPNVVSYTAVMGAYEKDAKWEHTIALRKDMRERALRPTLVSYGSAIAACPNRICRAANRLGFVSPRPDRTRKNVTWKPIGWASSSWTQPVTYHHSMRKSGCAPSSRGNCSSTPDIETAVEFGLCSPARSGHQRRAHT